MKPIQQAALLLMSITLSGCATMNSDFSCQATAKDSCLTIEQVDALTRFADEPAIYRPNSAKPALYKADINEPLLWVAQKEESGHAGRS